MEAGNERRGTYIHKLDEHGCLQNSLTYLSMILQLHLFYSSLLREVECNNHRQEQESESKRTVN
jgi:hypothetical protein